MSRDRPETPRPRRPLSPDERRLWNGIARSVVPLRRRPSMLAIEAVAPADQRAPAAAAQRHGNISTSRPARAAPPAKPAPPLAPLDKRQKRRLARGSEPIEARIDLHGRKLAEAHTCLLHSLRRAQADGARLALVITGKGTAAAAAPDHPSRERGVLRRQVPLWLALPEFRSYVVAVEEAAPAHGGSGALYVRLRRAAQ